MWKGTSAHRKDAKSGAMKTDVAVGRLSRALLALMIELISRVPNKTFALRGLTTLMLQLISNDHYARWQH
jgi:hypothetical protein